MEASILRELYSHGVAVPNILGRRGNTLLLEYLPGEPLPDWIERGDYDPEALAHALCDWFAAFYAVMPEGEMRGDVNGRNFLYDGTKIYSVDFEDRCFGGRAKDAGRLAAYIGTYRTRDPEKQAMLAEAFTRKFAARCECEPAFIFIEQEMELKAMARRRK